MLLEAKQIFQLLNNAITNLQQNGIDEAKLDCEILLCNVLKISKEQLYTFKTFNVTKIQINKYNKCLERRIKREPLAYIINKRYLMNLEFFVDKRVLIPRQETEFLIEQANKYINQKKLKQVLELCTGSGCISVCIAKENNVKILATDISKKAITVAKKNAIFHNVDNKIEFCLSNMFCKVPNKKFDLILSNPPYVTIEEYKNLEKELFFEPKKAFVAKNNGLFFYEQIAKKSKQFLSNNGIIIIELSSTISKQIVEIFKKYGYKVIEIVKDFDNLDRVLVLTNGQNIN